MSDAWTVPSKITQFNGGDRQAAKVELVRPIEMWDITVIINDAIDSRALTLFIQSHGQFTPFEWQSPRDSSPQRYRLIGGISSVTRNGGGSEPIFFTRSMRFRGIVRPEDEIFCSTTYSLPSLIIPPSSTTYYFLP
jgi:phage-related protein